MKRRSAHHRLPPRRGAIFLMALAMIVILTGLVLVFARDMRTEALASANQLAAVQADAVELGAEQWVLAEIESNTGDAVTITQANAEAIQVGNGYFWILNPDPTQDQTFRFGITDETGKLNLNTASSDQLMNLPSMTQDVADSIVDWRDTDDTPGPNGAETSYYESLAEPYDARNNNFETVEELMLVKNMTAQLLYGTDLNHNGVIDDAEKNANGMMANLSAGNTDTRGIFNYVTCYAPPAGGAPPTVGQNSSQSSSPSTPLTNVSDRGALSTTLSNALGASRANTLMANLAQQRTILSLNDFVLTSRITVSEYGQVADQLTSSIAAGVAPINVNTASEQALMSLLQLSQADADSLISARGTSTNTDMSWFFNALGTTQKVAAAADYVTDRSTMYSADIVAVSSDGRAFKRVRIVVDGTSTPAKILYRKDLTSLGWPLSPQIQTAMKAGKGPPDLNGTIGAGGASNSNLMGDN